MGPAATRCAGTVDDAPPLLRIPLPHDPAFSHLYIMTQRFQYRLTAPALALPTCLHCGHDGDERRSGASFGVRAGALDRRLGCGRRHPQHRLPSAVPSALQSAQAAAVLAPVAAPAMAPWGHPSARKLRTRSGIPIEAP